MDAWIRDVSRILLRHFLKISANRDDAQEIVQEAFCKWLLHVEVMDGAMPRLGSFASPSICTMTCAAGANGGVRDL